MKKHLIILSIAGVAFLTACSENGAKQNATQQQTEKADSIAALHRADSLANAAKKQLIQDSVNVAKMKDSDTAKAASNADKGGAKK